MPVAVAAAVAVVTAVAETSLAAIAGAVGAEVDQDAVPIVATSLLLNQSAILLLMYRQVAIFLDRTQQMMMTAALFSKRMTITVWTGLTRKNTYAVRLCWLMTMMTIATYSSSKL